MTELPCATVGHWTEWSSCQLRFEPLRSADTRMSNGCLRLHESFIHVHET
jgi:hypothetical protein